MARFSRDVRDIGQALTVWPFLFILPRSATLMKPTKHAGEKSVRTNVTTESHGDHGDPSQASTRSANPDLAPKDRIKRAMDDGRHNDAAKMLLAAIGSPGARGIPTTLVTRVVTELINDRTIQCGKVEKT